MARVHSVRVENLVKRFGGFVAVDRISFEVWQGEIFGFLGSNGAGKSTTIRMLCGLLRPTSGKAWVGGLDVYTRSEAIKQNIGYMSQRFSLYDELTVEENIDFFGGIYGLAGARRSERKHQMLERMELKDRRDTPTHLLPGGWKQRLALGCAILHEPPILFLDEPTSGVDPLARRSFWDLIKRLSEEGRTVFVTTHYMDEAEYCDRLALMHEGKVIALDTPRALRRAAAAQGFIHLESSDFLGAMAALEGLDEIIDVAVFGGGLHLRVEVVERAESLIRETLSRQGIEIRRMHPIEPVMEDVFVSLIEKEERRE